MRLRPATYYPLLENAVVRRAHRAIGELLDACPGRRPTVSDLSQAMGASGPALRRSLRHLGAPNPKALITRTCVEHAAELIRCGTKVDAALTIVGFHQKTNFNRQFRRMFGCLPHEYRHQSAG